MGAHGLTTSNADLLARFLNSSRGFKCVLELLHDYTIGARLQIAPKCQSVGRSFGDMSPQCATERWTVGRREQLGQLTRDAINNLFVAESQRAR